MLLETAKEILQKGHVCDSCLGRQFAQLLSGTTNRERGRSLRTVLAIEYSAKPFPLDKSNFSGFNFRKMKVTEKHESKKTEGGTGDRRRLLTPSIGNLPSSRCRICGSLFESLGKWSEEAARKLSSLECKTFVVASIMSPELVRNEENLWEDIGIEHCEPMKAELNRELGKLIAGKTLKLPDEGRPDVTVTLDLGKGRLDVKSNPVYFYGRYQKLVRGIPQTKWERYKETVEDIIAAPFMRHTGGSGHSLHASGREDIDARCLDWRPFVLEIESPRKREPSLKRMEAEINRTRKVRVSGLRLSDRKEVVRVKSLMPDKTYRVLASLERPVKEPDLKKLKRISVVKQQTPTRVLHRRADKTRTKRVKSVSWKILPKSRIEFTIKGEAGLYIKELVSGDNGRTKPSFSTTLGIPLKAEELDVIRIHLPKGKGFKSTTAQ